MTTSILIFDDLLCFVFRFVLLLLLPLLFHESKSLYIKEKVYTVYSVATGIHTVAKFYSTADNTLLYQSIIIVHVRTNWQDY